ncbi:PREDICTED: E3 ubiquitin-protein ligase TRIM71-like [Amphimedon queenslandica]|uniref:B box-type domain-containing protein n=1 Tax=Amphimedon queenslandica TaxID=400682 RepID=A0AAN0JB11_AMPQE|nr:PREDICTED: E3 ubiquitin-protein ligase TRIM71-like [Amphimedon queenslandica]|eukprot:XP_019853957.1 PREDICTED: E3 ubiquitin-protein ligase TRIM71-like [Amphimedon queenslandica]
MYSLMKKTAVLPNPQEDICSDHGRPLELFCEACNKVICVTCLAHDHKHHEYELITDSYTKHCQKLRECLSPVGRKKEALEKSERKLTEQAKRVIDARLKVLTEQMKSAERSLSLLEEIESSVDNILKTGSHQQVLGLEKQMIERMSEVTAGINMEELHPMEKTDFELSKDIKSLHHIGDILSHSSTALEKSQVKKINDCIRTAEKSVSFSLSLVAPDSSLLSVPLSSISCSLVPVVKVQVYGLQLGDTSLVIPINPYLDSVAPVFAIAELKGPWGVAVNEDNQAVITMFNGHCVAILDRAGKKMKSLGGRGGSGNVKFSSPRGVAITSDQFILVSDNHKIQKISMDGYLVASVGEKGNGPLQFNVPDGIAISPKTGQVYVADWNNHRIQVLNADLTFSHLFGSKGSASGQFQSPCDVAVDSEGWVYVADTLNNIIQKFTPEGNFVTQFGSNESGLGELDKPTGIAIDTAATGLVYVSEWGKSRISIFTCEGVFVNSFVREGKQFNNPYGISFDKDGFLYTVTCDC